MIKNRHINWLLCFIIALVGTSTSPHDLLTIPTEYKQAWSPGLLKFGGLVFVAGMTSALSAMFIVKCTTQYPSNVISVMMLGGMSCAAVGSLIATCGIPKQRPERKYHVRIEGHPNGTAWLHYKAIDWANLTLQLLHAGFEIDIKNDYSHEYDQNVLSLSAYTISSEPKLICSDFKQVMHLFDFPDFYVVLNTTDEALRTASIALFDTLYAQQKNG